MSFYWWQPFVSSIFKWWLAVFLLGWVSYPLVFRCFILLPDRGLGISKLLGIMLPVFAYAIVTLRWGMTVPFKPDGPPIGLVAVIAFFIILNLVLLRRSWRPLFSFLLARWQMVILYELAFVASYLLYLWFRSTIPDVTFDRNWYGAEKWDNLAILTSIWRNPIIPPMDPWLSGHALNYYYFSHLLWAMLARITGIAPQVAFNLALSTLFSLLVGASFSTGHAISERRSGGLWALLLIVFAGSLATWNQWRSLLRGFTSHGISGFFGAFSFWLPSDVLPDTRNEFPAFNWLLGDLHAHGTGLLFLLAAICLLVQMQRMREVEGSTWIQTVSRQPVAWLMLLILFAVMWATNSWDLLVVGLLGFFWILMESQEEQSGNLRISQSIQGLLIWSIAGIIGVSVLASFYSRYTYPPLEVRNAALAALPGPLGMLGSLGLVDSFRRTTPQQWLSFWGFFLFGGGAVWAIHLLRDLDALRPKLRWVVSRQESAWNSPLFALIAVAAAAVVFAYQYRTGTLWVSSALIVGIMACLHYLFKRRTFGPRRWALLLTLVALLLQIIPEFIYVDDPIANDPYQRYNTVFKLYYPAWALLALALSVFLSDLRPIAFFSNRLTNSGNSPQDFDAEVGTQLAELVDAPREKPVSLSRAQSTPVVLAGMIGCHLRKAASWAILILLTIVLVAGAGAYSVLAIGQRIQNSLERMEDLSKKGWSAERIQKTCRTLDGLAFLALPKYAAGDDLRLGLWMRKNLPVAQQIVESTGPSYEITARFSVISGIPSYMGWIGHESQWRGGNRFNPIFAGRNAALEVIYRSPSAAEALRVCRQNELRYVVVGALERMKYPRERLDKLREIGRVRKQFGGSILYEMNLGRTSRSKDSTKNLPEKKRRGVDKKNLNGK